MALEDPNREQENYPNEGCPPGKVWNWQLQRCMTPPSGPAVPAPTPGTGGGSCPPGQAMSRGGHPGNPMRCRPIGGGAAAPTGAPRAVGPTGAPAAVNADDARQGDMSSIIWNHIQSAMRGFDAPTLDRMKGQVFSAAMGRKAAGMESVNADLVSRGLARSGIGAEAAIDLENEAQRSYTGGVASILIKEVEFKMAALDKAQAHLDSLRQYIVSRESNANQREIGLAQIALGYKKIAAEKEMLKMQLDARGGGGGGGVDPFDQFLQLAGMKF